MKKKDSAGFFVDEFSERFFVPLNRSKFFQPVVKEKLPIAISGKSV